MFQFVCLPNGLSSGPRMFTKILKPLFVHLRLQGHTVLGYFDDIYVQGSTHELCLAAVTATVDVLTKCGFIIHPEKSVLQPAQKKSAI